MIYIRTKDKIIEVNDWYKKGYAYCEEDGIWKTPNQQADTIEELCDGFEIVRGKFNDSEEARCICVQCDTLDEIRSIITKCEIFYIKYEVFGFICVDGDSVRVAKMNERGCLELL